MGKVFWVSSTTLQWSSLLVWLNIFVLTGLHGCESKSALRASPNEQRVTATPAVSLQASIASSAQSVQSRLQALGYFTGRKDVTIDQAIVSFRRDQGLPLSTEVDQTLSSALEHDGTRLPPRVFLQHWNYESEENLKQGFSLQIVEGTDQLVVSSPEGVGIWRRTEERQTGWVNGPIVDAAVNSAGDRLAILRGDRIVLYELPALRVIRARWLQGESLKNQDNVAVSTQWDSQRPSDYNSLRFTQTSEQIWLAGLDTLLILGSTDLQQIFARTFDHEKYAYQGGGGYIPNPIIVFAHPDKDHLTVLSYPKKLIATTFSLKTLKQVAIVTLPDEYLNSGWWTLREKSQASLQADSEEVLLNLQGRLFDWRTGKEQTGRAIVSDTRYKDVFTETKTGTSHLKGVLRWHPYFDPAREEYIWPERARAAMGTLTRFRADVSTVPFASNVAFANRLDQLQVIDGFFGKLARKTKKTDDETEIWRSTANRQYWFGGKATFGKDALSGRADNPKFDLKSADNIFVKSVTLPLFEVLNGEIKCKLFSQEGVERILEEDGGVCGDYLNLLFVKDLSIDSAQQRSAIITGTWNGGNHA
ncbi:MAG: hypothetical protein WAU08_15180, partial [Flavobacteriales bacterium]